MLKSKRNKEISKAVDKSKDYSLEEAIKLLKEQSKVKVCRNFGLCNKIRC